MMRIISNILDNKLKLFICFWICVAGLYLPAYKAGFIAEFINYLQSYEHSSFTAFINREDTYVKSFYQVAMVFRYLYISLFGTHPLPWYILFTALHALTGVLVYTFCVGLFRDFSLHHARRVALAGTLLFLFNPNITEITIWKACDHYYISVILQLSVLVCCRLHITTQRQRYAWMAGILFAISTCALEIFYATQFLTLFLLTGYYLKSLISRDAFKKGLLKLFLPQMVLFLLHLVVFRLVYGSWVAHYGTTDEFVWSVSDMLKGYGKYMAYMVLMAGHYPVPFRESVYTFLSLPVVYYSIVALLLGAVSVSLFRFKKLSVRAQLLVFFAGAFICSITLCLTTYYHDLFSLYNSRRCYQPGIFLYMAVALIVFSGRGMRRQMIFFCVYLLTCLLLTGNMVLRWRGAAKIQYGVLRTFRWQEANTVTLLNVPSYFRDVRMISANEENEFADQLRYFRYPSIQGKIYSVAGYNMNQNWDGAHVTVVDSLTLKVTLNQWGSWWLHGYNGATSYETDLFRVDMKDPGHEYFISFKNRPTAMVILYQQGEQWRQVDMSKVGAEQW